MADDKAYLELAKKLGLDVGIKKEKQRRLGLKTKGKKTRLLRMDNVIPRNPKSTIVRQLIIRVSDKDIALVQAVAIDEINKSKSEGRFNTLYAAYVKFLTLGVETYIKQNNLDKEKTLVDAQVRYDKYYAEHTDEMNRRDMKAIGVPV